MADSIIFNLVEKIESLPFREFSLKSEIDRLRISLHSSTAVFSFAEDRHFSNSRISNWLREVRNVWYEADDVLDDFAYQVLRKQVGDSRGGFNSKVYLLFSIYNSFAYRLRIGHKIKEIRGRLELKISDAKIFGLVERSDDGRDREWERETTSPFLNASEVIGRERDIEIIEKFLMDSPGHNENVSVLPIVGIGGLGKTTIAQMVFNDGRVDCHFDKKIWVCLDDMKEFNLRQILGKIGICVVGDVSSINSISDSEQLQMAVQNNLRGRRFFLVLDEMWDVNRAKWLDLKELLECGAEGSKIVVTTRIALVALCVGTVRAHNLEGLPHEECVALFKKTVFSCEDAVDPDLMRMGDEIVRKCEGVPLAVKNLGILLFLKSNEHVWLHVRDTAIWKLDECRYGILHALKLSYDQLSSHLRQCFLFCSIFPKNYLFQDFLLISLWMAHGLLQSRANQDPIHVGRQYIKELFSRGFFQNFKEHSWYCGFKMHGLIRDLAIALGQEEFSTVRAGYDNFSENVRHVCFEEQNFPANSSHNAIRTVLTLYEGCGATFSETCISKFKLLRALSLANSEFEELPNSIGTLKHLRSLDLRGCRRLKRLPNSICNLHHLETLLLTGCAELEEFPRSMQKLVNLIWLWITTKQKHPTRNGIECINSLNFLALSGCENMEIFFVGNKVINLSSLQTLRISECGSLISLFPLNLGALEVLYIRNCGKLSLHGQEDDVSLQPQSLGSLTVQGLPLMEGLPQWIEGCARTLRYLKIKDCENLTELPQWLSNLTSLKTLKFVRCLKLLSLPEGMQNLTALIHVKIVECGVLSERCKKDTGEDWHKIAHVPNIVIEET